MLFFHFLKLSLDEHGPKFGVIRPVPPLINDRYFILIFGVVLFIQPPVSIAKRGTTGAATVLRVLGEKNNFFSLLVLLDHLPRAGRAITESDTQTWVLTRFS